MYIYVSVSVEFRSIIIKSGLLPSLFIINFKYIQSRKSYNEPPLFLININNYHATGFVPTPDSPYPNTGLIVGKDTLTFPMINISSTRYCPKD